MKFYSHAEVTKFLRELSEYYQKEAEKYGDKLGSRLRPGAGEGGPPKEDKKQEKKVDPKQKGGGGWIKIGTLPLNVASPESAITEVMYLAHEDLKVKLAKTNEVLKSFEQNANTLIPQNATFQLYMKNGVPERMVVEAQEQKKAAFNFDGKFRVV